MVWELKTLLKKFTDLYDRATQESIMLNRHGRSLHKRCLDLVKIEDCDEYILCTEC